MGPSQLYTLKFMSIKGKFRSLYVQDLITKTEENNLRLARFLIAPKQETYLDTLSLGCSANMVFSSHTIFILLLCIGVLAVHPIQITGLRSMDLALRWTKEHRGVVRSNQRMLEEFVMKVPNAEKKPVTVNRNIDPYQASKRTFRKGSDPIHNRT